MENQAGQERIFAVVQQLAAELASGRQVEVNETTHLEWDLGLASIERHELLSRLEAEFDCTLSPEAVFEAATVADLFTLSFEGAPLLSAPSPAPGATPPSVSTTDGTLDPSAFPSHARDLVEALLDRAERCSDRPRLVLLEQDRLAAEWTYRQLAEAAAKVAGGLLARGVDRGQRVAIMLATGTDFLAAYFGVLWRGAVPVPLYPPFRMDQIEDYVQRQGAILKLAGVRLLVSFDQAKPVIPLLKMQAPELKTVVTVKELDGSPPEPNPYPTALIQFTSGSTGLPKGVVLTHQALLANIRAYGQGLAVRGDDVTVSWLPLYHDMGLIGSLFGSIYHGTPLVLMGPQDFLARPSRWLHALHRYRGTISPAPNFAYEICARKIPDRELVGLDLSSWRVALNGAEAVRPETLTRFSQRFAYYGFQPEAHFPAYGLAEASLAVTFPPPGRGPLIDRVHRERLEKDGVVASCGAQDQALELVACGRPLPGMEIRVVDQQGRPLPERQRGHLQFRGPSALDEYDQNPEATRAVQAGEGWIRTGDLAYISEGELYLTGRSKDLIVKAGRNLYPEPIEDACAEVEGVRRGCVAALGLPNEEEGTELLVIVAELRSDSRHRAEEIEREMVARVSQRIGLAPDQIHLVRPGTIPKTPSGKIRRSACLQRLQEGRLDARGGWRLQVARLLLSQGKSLVGRALSWPLVGLKSLYRHAALVGCLAIPQAVGAVRPDQGRKLLRRSAQLYLTLSGVQLEVQGGLDVQGPYLVVSNHASGLDPVIVSAALPEPISFLVAPWVADHPLFRRLVSRLGHQVVRRGQAKAATDIEREISRRLSSEPMAAFPEGGIEITPGLRPFALGVFRAAAAAGVPVVPIALRGTRELQPWPKMVPSSGTVQVVVGPPLRAHGTEWSEVVELAARAREFLAQHCGDPLSDRRLRRVDE